MAFNVLHLPTSRYVIVDTTLAEYRAQTRESNPTISKYLEYACYGLKDLWNEDGYDYNLLELPTKQSFSLLVSKKLQTKAAFFFCIAVDLKLTTEDEDTFDWSIRNDTLLTKSEFQLIEIKLQ